jgi:hypothetical protein
MSAQRTLHVLRTYTITIEALVIDEELADEDCIADQLGDWIEDASDDLGIKPIKLTVEGKDKEGP